LDSKLIKTALISVYNKEGLEKLIHTLADLNIRMLSTGGTQSFIENLGYSVDRVEDLTNYPSILDGRVKTLHPKIFGGILAMRNESHLNQLQEYDIPTIDLVIVDLYPFEETVKNSNDELEIIEKIDIGGISLIRAAAKNFNDVVIVASKDDYDDVNNMIIDQRGHTNVEQRKVLAKKAFSVSSHYDTAIYSYFNHQVEPVDEPLKISIQSSKSLRYGENPHQKATFYGNLEDKFDIYGAKELSFNNLVDVDAAVSFMSEFQKTDPTFAILKHTNACGVATRDSLFEAYKDALSCDPTSAFGGILISNSTIDLITAEEINKIFYEVLIAPDFTPEALTFLTKNPKRIILKLKNFTLQNRVFKTLLNGVISQDSDITMEGKEEFKTVTTKKPSESEIEDLIFALKCAKHLKSNTIVMVKNKLMIGMGCGQTSRVDACKQAISKAESFGFDLSGSVMASDAFFPFPDCVEIAHKAGITAVVQPGGSIKDQLSIDYCNENNLAMVLTGIRHFKH